LLRVKPIACKLAKHRRRGNRRSRAGAAPRIHASVGHRLVRTSLQHLFDHPAGRAAGSNHRGTRIVQYVRRYPATVAAVDTVITNVVQASNLDPAQIQLPPNPPNCAVGLPCALCPQPPFPPGGCPAPTSGSIYVCQNVQLNPVAPNGTPQPTQCGAVVSFQYPFQFYFPGTSLNMSTVLMTAQAQSRMED
jgi:hypothetical protein